MRIDGSFDDLGCPRVSIQSATGQVFDAVVNTAYSGEFWMPKNILMSLGFVSRGSVNVELPDGTIQPAELFAGGIMWFGEKRRVSAVASDNQSTFAGMGLLRHASLTIHPEKGLVYVEAPFQGGPPQQGGE